MKLDVGIILTTKDRADFVIRQLEYYILTKNNHPIYIGDSSNDNEKQKLLDRMDYFKKYLINYIV